MTRRDLELAEPAGMHQMLPLALFLMVAAASTSAIFAKLSGAPSATVALWRTAIAAVLLAPFGVRASAALDCRIGGRDLALIGLSGLFLAVHFAVWFNALSFTTVASATVLGQTTPLFVAVAAPFVTGDRLQRGFWQPLSVALAGAALIGWGDVRLTGQALIGDLMAVGGAISLGLYLLIGRKLRGALPLTAYMALVCGAAALMLMGWIASFHVPVWGFSSQTVWWLVCAALVPQMLGHTLGNWAVRKTDPTLVTTCYLGEPLGATLIAFFVFAESPGWQHGVGGVLVVGGIVWALRMARYGRSPITNSS